MNIFLTSQASNVLEKIAEKLPKSAAEYKVAFVRTAANPYPSKPWCDNDRAKLAEIGFVILDLDIAGKSKDRVKEILDQVDIIFVAGGNTFYLLDQARKSGFDDIVKQQVSAGKIYIGSSAGSILVGPDIAPVAIIDDPNIARLKSTEGLGLVDFIILPHAGREKYRKLQDQVLKQFGNKFRFIQLDDFEFVDGEGNKK